jgi:2-amino-4-hydroxy-6-hydroxymethyldihydropteridine diphosphokinase
MVTVPDPPILIGLGANLPSEAGPPVATLEAALGRLASAGIITLKRSRWFMSPPVPPSDQPWFVNGVAAVATALDPAGLLAALHRVEAAFGRVRSVPNAARTLDLDLLAYGDRVESPPTEAAPDLASDLAPDLTRPRPVLPHPRLADRAFVLLPLADVAPAWYHPATGRPLAELIRALGDTAGTRPLE